MIQKIKRIWTLVLNPHSPALYSKLIPPLFNNPLKPFKKIPIYETQQSPHAIVNRVNA